MIEEMSGDFFQQLRGFYHVAQLGSMGQAAKVLRRSQSSVSRLIKQLEQSLGIVLFRRMQKGVDLTVQGEELFRQAVEIFDKIRALHSELDLISREPSGVVSFCINQTSLLYFAAPLLSELHRELPKVRINIHEFPGTYGVIRQLDERECDFAFAFLEHLPFSLEFYPLYTAEIMLAVPVGFDISACMSEERVVDINRLKDQNYIVLPETMGFARYIEQHMIQRRIFWDNCTQAPNLLTVLHLVAAGMGLGIVDEAAALSIGASLPLQFYPLTHIVPPLTYGLCYLKEGYVSPQARAVIDFLKERGRVKPDA